MSGLGMTCLRVPLVLTEAGEALGFGGEVAFGLSLELLRRVSPSAARELHDHTSPKPFAIALEGHDAKQAQARSLCAPQTSHPENRDMRPPGAKEADRRELQPA